MKPLTTNDQIKFKILQRTLDTAEIYLEIYLMTLSETFKILSIITFKTDQILLNTLIAIFFTRY